MTPIKQAVTIAMEFAAAVLGTSRARDMRLEEVESGEVEGTPVWIITLSLQQPNLTAGGIEMPSFGERDYKTFTVRKDTAEVVSMKIRELAGHNA
jgi:hypothetical protein